MARVISLVGLSIALLLATIHYLAFRRAKHDSPDVAIGAEAKSVLRKRGLSIVRASLHNRSFRPNTVVGVDAYQARFPFTVWRMGRKSLKVGDLSMSSDHPSTLSAAPWVTLSDEDWKQLFTGPEGLPREGLWRLPIQLQAVSPRTLLIAVSSAHVDFSREHRLVFVIKDIIGNRFRTFIRFQRVE